jgi:putative restriction endonuclease
MPDARPSDEKAVRLAAFTFLDAQRSIHGDVLPWSVLLRGFDHDGRRVPLVAQQGIFKPAVLHEVPLSIRTTPEDPSKPRPYDDGIGLDGLLRYRFRGTDPSHPHNVGLRLAMRRQTPLVYLFGIIEGQYLPAYPVYVVGEDAADLAFRVSVDDRQLAAMSPAADTLAEVRRSYVTRLTTQRLHQATFRQRVLRAYQERCAICRLKHAELLDAAHILPDGHPRGEPIVPNGLALCRLHHGAFDANILGVRPDLVIEIRADIMEEVDGPMLRHGLQEIAGQRLLVPRSARERPRDDLLEERYELFRKAG